MSTTELVQSVLGAQGRVDLYSWATGDAVRLRLRDGRWVVRTDANIDWPRAWSRDTFLDLASRLLRAP